MSSLQMSFDRSLGSPLFIVGDIIVVPVEETGRGLFKEIFFVVRWLSTYCLKLHLVFEFKVGYSRAKLLAKYDNVQLPCKVFYG